MKSLLLLLFLCASEVSAQSHRWVGATIGVQGTVIYYDAATLKRSDSGSVTAWVKLVNNAGVQTSSSLVEYDCQGK